MTRSRGIASYATLIAGATAIGLSAGGAVALSIGPDFIGNYTAVDLGSVPGLPANYGGLTLLAGDPNTLLIGGGANGAAGRLYTIGVTRDPVDMSITGFIGTALQYGDVGEYNDGGVAYGPGGVLFTAQWNVNNLGQTKPGSLDEDRVDALGQFGVGGSSISAVNFVPAGFANAGQGKIVSYSSGNWYDLNLAPDGNGTFDIVSAPQIDLDPIAPGVQGLPGGPEGFVYIDSSNPDFSTDSLLVSDYAAGRVSAYEIDGNANPILASRRDFLTGLSGAEGAFVDPVTGDFLFSTFGGGNRVVRVDGFLVPPPPPAGIPLPAAGWAMLAALGALAAMRRSRQA